MTVTNSRIVAVGALESMVPPGARRIDLPDMTLLPGPINPVFSF